MAKVKVLLALVLAIGVLGFSFDARPALAKSAQSPQCTVLRVHLLGGVDHYTQQCLSTKPIPRGANNVTPYVGVDNNCASSDLEVWLDINYGSIGMCLYGTGEISNLHTFGYAYHYWGDVISSYKSGIWDGDFAWDINMGGNLLGFYPNESCPDLRYTTRSNNGVSNWNDQISSLEIYTTFSASPGSC